MRLSHQPSRFAVGLAAVAAVVTLGISASGWAAGEGGAGEPPASEQSYNAAFDKSTHDSCVQAATSNGASGEAAERYCGCVVGELGKLTEQQKEDLTPSSPELQAAQKTCQPQLDH